MTRLASAVLLLIFVLFFSTDLKSKHIVGGDVSYEFVSFNAAKTQVTFKVIFNMYRDRYAVGAPYDPDAEFGVYQQQVDGSWEFYDKAIADPQEIDTIFYEDDPCIFENSGVGVESAFYEMFFTLDIIDRDYMVAYQKCCRNNTSSNIFNDNIGSVFDIIITPEAQKTGNNSATFNEYPPIFICSNYPMREDISGIDVDGDELVYSLCSPLQSGGVMGAGTDPCFFFEPTVGPSGCLPPFPEIQFKTPYSAQNPMGGLPSVSLDANGLLSGIPTLTGQYVVGVCIEEYRNGVLLSTIRRDFQFNVVPCQKAIAVELFADELAIENGNVISVIKSCGDSTIQFRSQEVGATAQSYEWFISGPDGSEFYAEKNATIGNLNLLLTELGAYNGFLVVNDGTVCTDTAFFQVQRTAGIDTEFISVSDSCFLAPIEFTDISSALQSNIIGREWILNEEYSSTDSITAFEFSDRGPKEIQLITTDDQGCIDTLSRMIDYNPPHDKTAARLIDTTLCFGDSIFFDNVWMKEAGTYSDILQFSTTGCDSIGRELILDYWPQSTTTDTVASICVGESVSYYGVDYSESGVYQHSTLSILSGCDSIRHEIDLDVQLYPGINFESTSIFVPGNSPYAMPVTIDGSYTSITWSPEDGLNCGDCPSPIINYNSDTTYNVIVTTEADCTTEESIYVDFVVVPERYFFPTILSKDRLLENENNLYLQTIDDAYESVTYNLQVMDRWGSLQFDGKNLSINERTVGWSSKDVEPGVYIYRFEINEFFETKTEVGSITVIK